MPGVCAGVFHDGRATVVYSYNAASRTFGSGTDLGKRAIDTA